MSDYIVSARKYRPTSFDAVVGQKALTTTLKNAIAGGKLAHAYLFCGPRGVGKTTSARIFAKTINCLNPTPTGEACDACESCVAFNEGRSYNIHELDAASNNSVDDIRELIEQVQIPPQVGRYKVFIIDEVHMLSQAAFNAFLKTLEEPPAHAIFILATTEKHKILPTILSRCQIYDFNRMEVPETVAHLKHVAESEGIKYEEEALNVIARKADGGMRDALSIFDQVASFTNGNITYAQTIENLNVLDYDYYFEVTDRLLEVDIPQVMLLLDKVLNKGFEAGHFIGGLAAHFRDLLVSRDAQTLPLLEVAESVRARYAEQAARCTPRFLYAALKLCNDCDINYRTAPNKRLLVELTLIQVAQLLQQEDVPPSGRRPTLRLLPIFKPAADQVPTAGAPQQKTSAPPSANVGTANPAMTPTAHGATTTGCGKTANRFAHPKTATRDERRDDDRPRDVNELDDADGIALRSIHRGTIGVPVDAICQRIATGTTGRGRTLENDSPATGRGAAGGWCGGKRSGGGLSEQNCAAAHGFPAPGIAQRRGYGGFCREHRATREKTGVLTPRNFSQHGRNQRGFQAAGHRTSTRTELKCRPLLTEHEFIIKR